MKDINAVLAAKEREVLRVKRDIQALHIVIALLMDDDETKGPSVASPPSAPPAPAPPATVKMP